MLFRGRGKSAAPAVRPAIEMVEQHDFRNAMKPPGTIHLAKCEFPIIGLSGRREILRAAGEGDEVKGTLESPLSEKILNAADKAEIHAVEDEGFGGVIHQ